MPTLKDIPVNRLVVIQSLLVRVDYHHQDFTEVLLLTNVRTPSVVGDDCILRFLPNSEVELFEESYTLAKMLVSSMPVHTLDSLKAEILIRQAENLLQADRKEFENMLDKNLN